MNAYDTPWRKPGVVHYTDQYGNPGVLSSTLVGGLMYLRSVGIMYENVTTSTSQNGSVGMYNLRFKLIAISEDAYISTGTSAIVYEQLSETGEVLNLPSSAALTSSGDITGDYYKIDEGSTETFTLTVNVDNSSGTIPRNIRICLKDIKARFGSAVSELESYPATLLKDAKTELLLIPNGNTP
jgi:hypothetical protein